MSKKADTDILKCSKCGNTLYACFPSQWKVVKCEGKKGHVIKNLETNKVYEA